MKTAVTVVFGALLCTPALAITPDETITTTIKDALPVAAWVDDITALDKPIAWGSYRMYPGYWTLDTHTYCLHAGKYSPVQGSGYVIATPKGGRVTLIQRVLSASVAHPELNQQDVQVLIWSIEAVTPFHDMQQAVQTAARTLLSAEDIATLQETATTKSQPSGWLSQLPSTVLDRIPGSEKVSEAASYLARLKSILTDPSSTYAQIEAVAVPARSAQYIPSLSVKIPHGNWAYVSRGIYMRAFPHGYPQSDLEFVSVRLHDVRRDAYNRIVHWTGTFGSIDVVYANLDSSPVSPFREVRIEGKLSNQHLTLTGHGFAVASAATAVGNSVDCGPIGAECAHRVSWLKSFYADVFSYRQLKKLSSKPDAALLAYHPRLDFATGVAELLAGQADDLWLRAMRGSLRSEQASVGCLLSGDCMSPNGPSSADARPASTLPRVALGTLSIFASTAVAGQSDDSQSGGIPWCAENCYSGGDHGDQLPPDCQGLNPPPFFVPVDENVQRLGAGGGPPSWGKAWGLINSLLGGGNSFNPETDNACDGTRG